MYSILYSVKSQEIFRDKLSSSYTVDLTRVGCWILMLVTYYWLLMAVEEKNTF